jgi:hypothetical protein
VQRKPKEDQTTYVRKRHFCLRLRSHTAAKGFASGEQRERGLELVCCCNGGAYRGVAKRRRVRPFASYLNVGKLEAQCSKADRREIMGQSGHE